MVICWKGGVASRKSKFIFYAKFWFQKIHSKAKKTVANLLNLLRPAEIKIPRDLEFPAIFQFAVCCSQREEACSRVRQQREHYFLSFRFDLPHLSACVMFCLFFYANWPVNCQCLHKREENSARKRADVWLSPSQRLSTVLCERSLNY